MEKGHIKDEDITASSAFDFKSVGPHLARLDQDMDGGAWCPKKVIGNRVTFNIKNPRITISYHNFSIFYDIFIVQVHTNSEK